MNALKTVELLRKYSKCEKCGSDKIGNGSGTVEVEEDTFKRTCKCGWVVVINDTPEGALSSARNRRHAPKRNALREVRRGDRGAGWGAEVV